MLEIGSGPTIAGRTPYSAGRFFKHCEFVRSDINPAFGHRVIDITVDRIDGYDAIVCANILEHVLDFRDAIDNIARWMHPGSRAIIVVPFLYPLHDEPQDYWRFTEHSLRDMFLGFSTVEVRHRGFRSLPFIYSVIAVK